MGRPTASASDLSAVARAALGSDRRAVRAERLRGGSKKGVYRIGLDDGSAVIAYVWSAAKNYWTETSDGDPGDASQ